jgi:cytochrome b
MPITFVIVVAFWVTAALAVDQMLFSFRKDRLPDKDEHQKEPQHDHDEERDQREVHRRAHS